MSDDQKSEALGGLVGGAIAGRGGVRGIRIPVPKFELVPQPGGLAAIELVVSHVVIGSFGAAGSLAASGSVAMMSGGAGRTGNSEPKPERTQPTGPKGGRPEGEPTPVRKGDSGRSDLRENESSDLLAKEGYRVDRNPKVPPPKKPDYRIEGKIFDNIAPRTNNARNIVDRIAEEKVATGQADRIVLNLDDSNVSLKELSQALESARNTPGHAAQRLREIIVIRGGQVIPFFP